MKKQLKAALAATLALVMALTIVPVSALSRLAAKAEVTLAWTVPSGYNVHDYTKCVEFLEQTDENGVKNGEKLSSNYDPNDPETWGLRAEVEDLCFHWMIVNGEKRVSEINVELWELCGCLDVSGCTALERLWCYNNNLTELDVSSNTALERLYCENNNLTELDVSCCTALERLSCENNSLTELGVSDCTALSELSCDSNNLTELDLSNNPNLPYDHILTDGNGRIGYFAYNMYSDCSCSIYASPNSGASFEGFYDESGALISEGEWSDEHEAYIYESEGLLIGTIIARFSGGFTPGDIDGNGSVSAADAITTLRLSMQLLDGSGMNTDAADMDGNGAITIADAIMVLRVALGIS